jgi:hypothetical protein
MTIKKYVTYIMLSGAFILSSCFDEKEILLPDTFSYVAFEGGEVNILEGSISSFDVKVVYSGATTSADIAVPISITDGEGTLAVDGVDYSIDGGLSGRTIPAGQFSTTVKVTILDNDDAVGARLLKLQLGDVSGFKLGAPDTDGVTTFAITILEDDLNIFGYTSFEEPTAGDVNLFNFDNGTEQTNNPGENSVDYTSIGGEMGFDTSYLPGQEGGADDPAWGVTKFQTDGYDASPFPDGAQAYLTSDADGLAEIVFDELTIPGTASFLQISLSTWFVDGGSWEDDDEFDVFWRTEDGDELVISLRSDGANMTDTPDGSGNNIGGKWTLISGLVENIKTGRLVIQIGSDSGAEVSLFDNIKIQGF